LDNKTWWLSNGSVFERAMKIDPIVALRQQRRIGGHGWDPLRLDSPLRF
jgi:hypothetical protein